MKHKTLIEIFAIRLCSIRTGWRFTVRMGSTRWSETNELLFINNKKAKSR